LAAIQIIGDPGREQGFVTQQVFAGHRPKIKRLDRLVKFETHRSDGLELGELLRRQRPSLRREPPGLVLKKRLSAERGLNRFVGQR